MFYRVEPVVTNPAVAYGGESGVPMTQEHYDALNGKVGHAIVQVDPVSLKEVVNNLHHLAVEHKAQRKRDPSGSQTHRQLRSCLCGLSFPLKEPWVTMAHHFEGRTEYSIDNLRHLFECGVTVHLYSYQTVKDEFRINKPKVTYAANGAYQALNFGDRVETWTRGAPFFDKTWKDVGVST